MVDDDDNDESPSPEPRTDSRSALPRGFRAWRRLRIIKHDESCSLVFFLHETVYMELEWKSEEVQGANEIGGRALGVGGAPPRARPLPRGPPGCPPTPTPTLYICFRREKIREKTSARFTIRSRCQALKPLGRADLESVRGSREGNPSPSSSSTIRHHQFHDAHRRA